MTIVVGLIADEGVVVASDSQAGSFRGVMVKRADYNKIYVLGEEKDSAVKAVLAGAGRVAFVNKLVNKLRQQWSRQRFTSVDEFENAVENTMVELAKKYYFDRARKLGLDEEGESFGPARKRKQVTKGLQLQPFQIPHAHLLVGATDTGGGRFLATIGPEGIAETEERFTSLGSGSAYAEYVLSRLYKDNLTIEQALECAVYTIEEVKKVDPDCGGPVRAAAVTDTEVQEPTRDDLKDLVAKLAIRDDLLAQMWRAMVLGHKSASDVGDFLGS